MDEIKKNHLVSVIVSCFNLGRYLGEALESVSRQTFSDWECIIVDNGSTDNTKEIAQSYTSKDKRFRYLFCENKGVSAARNFAIKNSNGKYILPLDADDKMGRDYLKDAVRILDDNSSIKIVYCEAQLFGKVNRKWKLPPFTMKGMLLRNLIFCSALYRRMDYNKTQGYNEKMVTGFEDWDFWLDLLKEDGEVFRIPKIYFYYRIRKGSRSMSLTRDQIGKLRQDLYHNHKQLYEKNLDIPAALFEWHEVMSSEEYRWGKIIVRPLRKLKSLFNR